MKNTERYGYRLMTWNLLEGGHSLRSPVPEPSDRIGFAQQVVQRNAPDILILNEALWCAPYHGHVFDYARLFGFEHSYGELYDKHWGNLILSRFPISDIANYRIYNRGGFLASIDTPDGVVQVGTYHPHPSRYPQHKAFDYRVLIEQAQPHLPVLIGGDFNAISPADNPDRQFLAKAFKRFSKKPVSDSARFIDAGVHVFDMFDLLGFKDAIPVHNRRLTMPTRLISPKNDDSSMRIDHILANPHVLIRNGWVDHHPDVDKASDHYPVLLDFSL